VAVELGFVITIVEVLMGGAMDFGESFEMGVNFEWIDMRRRYYLVID
jgi:hypothetical protein